MKIVEQLALFLDNEPGTLAAVCDALAAERISIYALSVADSSDYAVIRLVLSDPRRALHLFEERGTLVIESDVLMLEGSNKPGGLSAIVKALAKKKVNIDYAYLATLPTAKKGLLILSVSDVKRAQKVLEDAGLDA